MFGLALTVFVILFLQEEHAQKLREEEERKMYEKRYGELQELQKAREAEAKRLVLHTR